MICASINKQMCCIGYLLPDSERCPTNIRVSHVSKWRACRLANVSENAGPVTGESWCSASRPSVGNFPTEVCWIRRVIGRRGETSVLFAGVQAEAVQHCLCESPKGAVI